MKRARRTRDRWLNRACVACLLVAGCSQGGADDAGGAGKSGSHATAGTMSSGATGGTSGSGMSGAGGTSAGTGAGAGAPATGGTGGANAGTGANAGAGAGGGSAGIPAGGSATGGATTSGAGGISGGMAGSAGDAAGAGVSGAGMAGMAGGAACPTVSDFATWPDSSGPLGVGKLAVTDFKGHTGDEYGGAGYALALSWYGALRFTQQIADTPTNAMLISDFGPYLNGSKMVDNSASATVDYRVFGVLPLEIFLENGDTMAKDLGMQRADAQWNATTSDGITKDARYWIDDMYMITGLQVMAYRATRDMKYLDRAAKTMLAYHQALQQTDGLFWHTKDAHAYWGRANGWVAAGMAELLLELPAGAQRDSVMAGFKKEMDGLLPLQISGGTDDGCWRQVLDLATANAESSCTAMFTFALATGAKNGWLTDPKYAAAARKGWLALAAKTDSSGKLDKVCPGTGAAPNGDLNSQQQYYAKIALVKGDLHGQAPLLWSAFTLLRTDCPGVR